MNLWADLKARITSRLFKGREKCTRMAIVSASEGDDEERLGPIDDEEREMTLEWQRSMAELRQIHINGHLRGDFGPVDDARRFHLMRLLRSDYRRFPDMKPH
jgi:hypothetical protein